MSAHTPIPWTWLKFGNEWHLAHEKGARPIVLTMLHIAPKEGELCGDKVLAVGEGRPRILVPLTPDHPDAAFIVRACNNHERLMKIRERLLEACKEAAKQLRDHLITVNPHGGELVEQLEAAIADAEA